MDEEKEAILKEIEAKTKELERLNMKIQCFTEVISHLRSRVGNIEARKREIHNEILDIKDKVRIWETVKTK